MYMCFHTFAQHSGIITILFLPYMELTG